MNYNRKKPCGNCPFLDSPKAVRLHPARAEEIGYNMLSSGGGDFVCHKGLDKPERERSHCAGAIRFALKHDNMTQMMRISQRLGMFDPEEFMAIDPATIIDDVEELEDA